jgi:hypothetical protein
MTLPRMTGPRYARGETSGMHDGSRSEVRGFRIFEPRPSSFSLYPFIPHGLPPSPLISLPLPTPTIPHSSFPIPIYLLPLYPLTPLYPLPPLSCRRRPCPAVIIKLQCQYVGLESVQRGRARSRKGQWGLPGRLPEMVSRCHARTDPRCFGARRTQPSRDVRLLRKENRNWNRSPTVCGER